MLSIKLIELDDNDFDKKVNLYGNSIFPIEYEDLKNNYNVANYISFDGLGIDLDDKDKVFYSGEFAGYLSNSVSSDIYDNYYGGYTGSDLQLYIDLYEDEVLPEGITFLFYGHCCSSAFVHYSYNAAELHGMEYKINGDELYLPIEPYGIRKGEIVRAESIYITLKNTPLPYQSLKIQSIIIGKINTLDKFKSCELLEEINVLSDDLPINSLNFSVVTKEPIEFESGTPMNVYSNGRYYGTFYLDDAKRISEHIYSIKALNSIQNLENNDYREWNTGTDLLTFKEQIENLCNLSLVLPNSKYSAFGNIPINSCRYALCLYAFACRFMIDSSRSSLIYLKSIPEIVSSAISTADKKILGEATYTKSKPITLAKMQYALSFTGGTQIDTIELKNPANKRILYYFDEPVEIADEQPNGVTIYSSSNNYIDFISTVPNISLNVYKVKYTYTNVDILNNSIKNAKKNEKDFSKFNLRGNIFDNNGLGTHLFEQKRKDILKFIQSRGTVSAKIILEGERVGGLIQIETAYDGIKTGIITSMNIHFGYRDTADIEVLEWPIG